ncbi:hypothetical protein GCM10010520_65490 [Rhizobium viscosum]
MELPEHPSEERQSLIAPRPRMDKLSFDKREGFTTPLVKARADDMGTCGESHLLKMPQQRNYDW